MPIPPPPRTPAETHRTGVLVRWFLGTVVGTTLGHILAVALTAVAADALFAVTTSVNRTVRLVVVVIIGAVDGGSIALGQWFALRAEVPRLAPVRWILLSALAGAAGWGVASTSAHLQSVNPHAGVTPSEALVAGMVVGLMLGIAQGSTLRRALGRPLPWVSANAAGFAAGLTASAWLERTLALPSSLPALVGGPVTGFVVAALTGAVLVLLGRVGGRR
ncbi:MAG: hypothetical protein R3A78_02470 [Polyangiales bacterium]